MPRYFFDFHRPTGLSRDEIGSECSSPKEARLIAVEVLSAIAKDAIPRDGDRQAFSALVRDESNVTVYTATLTFVGLWLGDTPIPAPEASD